MKFGKESAEPLVGGGKKCQPVGRAYGLWIVMQGKKCLDQENNEALRLEVRNHACECAPFAVPVPGSNSLF